MLRDDGFVAKLQAAGFASVITLARPGFFDLWALASMSARPEADLRAFASQFFPQA